MKIKYCGPALDYSGYGEANRHDIAALDSVGVDVTTELTRHCLEIADFGPLGELVQGLHNKKIDYPIKIIHTTPNIYGNYIEPGKYNIGRLFWETDKLPKEFARGASLCNEIWTGSEFNKRAIRNAGVNVPIFVIPEAIVTPAPKSDPYIVENEKDFKFYSIFEWTTRKNPEALLEAYWREFENDEGVSLTLKTYVDNFDPRHRKEIGQYIKDLKKKVKLDKYPPLYIFRQLMDRHQIYRFHNTFDCFVSAHRGEGWGIPQMEAMLMGKPVISTSCGGIHEYISDVSLLVPCEMVPVENVSRNAQWYCNDQYWAEIDIDYLRSQMRFLYSNQKAAKTLGKKAQKAVEDRFSLKVVGQLMKERLEKIYENAQLATN